MTKINIPVVDEKDMILEKEKDLEGKLEESRLVAIFVVHEHQASHHHWDLRLEMEGVLKSWAVPKEPPTEVGVKRLAIQVDDHDIEYADFEGIIPEGQYGAGTVKIWDKGEYILLEKKPKSFSIEFKGKKLTGKYSLIKFKGEKQWLFFKRG